MQQCLNGPSPQLAITDVDDMYQDSLKDQAEKLQIPGFVPENESKLQKLPLQGGINPKKLRKMQELQSTEDK